MYLSLFSKYISQNLFEARSKPLSYIGLLFTLFVPLMTQFPMVSFSIQLARGRPINLQRG